MLSDAEVDEDDMRMQFYAFYGNSQEIAYKPGYPGYAEDARYNFGNRIIPFYHSKELGISELTGKTMYQYALERASYAEKRKAAQRGSRDYLIAQSLSTFADICKVYCDLFLARNFQQLDETL